MNNLTNNSAEILITKICDQVLIMQFIIHLTDVDECETGSHRCHDNAGCTDTPGNHTCKCKTGYLGDGKISCTGV